MNYDTYKKRLIEGIAEHTKENGDPFKYANDGDYPYMLAMDALALDLEDRGGLLGFAITYTTEGEGNPSFLNVSYWSNAIGLQISFGECVFKYWMQRIRHRLAASTKDII